MDLGNYNANETLRDGTVVAIRSIRRKDSSSVLAAFKSMDKESIYRRFFSPKKGLSPAELEQLTDVDFNSLVALVVTTQTAEGEVLIGGGRYAVDDPGSGNAEVAFMTTSNYRGLGVASLILSRLACIARDAGVTRFGADVLAENQPMLAVFRRSGLPMKTRRDGSTFHVTLSLQA